MKTKYFKQVSYENYKIFYFCGSYAGLFDGL